jgi:hypothetical protein
MHSMRVITSNKVIDVFLYKKKLLMKAISLCFYNSLINKLN